MNILSKQLLYQPKSYTYTAYYINNGVVTSLGTVTDLAKTFVSTDEAFYTNVFVYEGDLYSDGGKVTTNRNISSVTGRSTSSSYFGYFMDEGEFFSFTSTMSITQIGSATDWIKVCGYANSSSYRGFAEASDGLYVVYNRTSRSGISALSGWTKITGYGASSSANYYGYGINAGKLYYLYANGNGIVQQGTDTTWTDVTGSYENGSWYGYGINAGKLYALAGTPTQIGTDTTWTKVAGTAKSNGTAFAYGINAGKLYALAGTTATQVGNSSDWKSCSGFSQPTGEIALAYDSSALYGVKDDGTTVKLMDGTFVYCGGNYSSNAFGLAIRRT